MGNMNSDTLKEARRLYRLGMAIHWLEPKSKKPVGSGWTTGPRKKWEQLERSYSALLNVGVRLGAASKINDKGYLAVIDVDVKSTEKRHRKEALDAVKRLTGGAPCPVVMSGRGNGSRHLYCVTEKPFPPYDFAKSDELVKTYMPSVSSVSKRDRAGLTEAEIAEGYRIRPAWEISAMSEGRQVVLPPSIHPDSNKPYTWREGLELEDIDALPLLKLEIATEDTSSETSQKEKKVDTAAPETSEKEKFEFTPHKVDLQFVELSDRIRNGILTGDGVEDRSAFLLPACSALHGAGLSRDEILSVLTEKETFLGACAYDHAKTTNRARAARWVYRYTLKKVLEEKSADRLFGAHAEIEDRKLTKKERAEQEEEFKTEKAEGEFNSRDHGFYQYGARGALNPDYDELLKFFEEQHPYRTISDMKGVFVWNGMHYEHCDVYDIKGFAEKHFDPKPSEKYRAEFLSKVFANHVSRRSFFLETTEGKFNFQNGVIDLADEKPGLKPHSPKYGFRGVLPYKYDPAADCPVFKAWLASVMMEDRELFNVLQEFMGYVIRGGDYKFHKALWLDGVGRNGKSTFIDVLKALIGPGNFSTISIKSLVQDKFAGAELDGKIANFSEETSPQELADSGPFKNLTGDGDIFAQKKFGDPYFFRNRAKLIMSYNTIPDLKDLSPGMLARPLIVPFRKRIKEADQDRGLKARLLAELPGIFNFALRGWKRLDKQGRFTRSMKSELALQKTAEESCNAFQWVEHYVEFDETSEQEFTARDLYAAYRAREPRYAYPFNKFMRRINAHQGIRNARARNEKRRFYKGILLR